jgi:hypothetical protein
MLLAIRMASVKWKDGQKWQRSQDRQADWHISQKAHRKTERQKDRKTERQNDRKTERQKDRKTERQKDRKTERQKDRKTERNMNALHIFI